MLGPRHRRTPFSPRLSRFKGSSGAVDGTAKLPEAPRAGHTAIRLLLSTRTAFLKNILRLAPLLPTGHDLHKKRLLILTLTSSCRSSQDLGSGNHRRLSPRWQPLSLCSRSRRWCSIDSTVTCSPSSSQPLCSAPTFTSSYCSRPCLPCTWCRAMGSKGRSSRRRFAIFKATLRFGPFSWLLKDRWLIVFCYISFFCYVVLGCVMLCYVILCYLMLCYVMLCYVMLCYVMLCYSSECYIISFFYIISYYAGEGRASPSSPPRHPSRSRPAAPAKAKGLAPLPFYVSRVSFLSSMGSRLPRESTTQKA